MKSLMSFVFTLALLFVSEEHLNAQRYETRTASVSFQSKTALEEIYSENNQVTSILKIEGDKKIVAFNVIMRSFKFEKALMEEHFNEKYVHSERYPSAKFIGEIETPADLTKRGIYKNLQITGMLTFHGVEKPLTILADIEVDENSEIKAFSTFKIRTEEYNIQIPKLVENKVSKEVIVTVDALYKQSK